MNFNNRQRTPALVPRALRPKAVCVSPIQSPIRGIVPRPVIPVMSPQGRGQYVLGGSVVPQVYPGGSVPRNITATQTRFATQTRVDAQTRLAAQTRLDAQARLGAQSRMTAQAIFAQRGVPQTVSAAQQQINTRALSAQGTVGRIAPQPQVLYPRVAAMAQNSPAAQPRNSSHALYQQSAAMSQTGPRPRMAGQVLIPQPVQVGNRVPMPQPNVPMLVPRAPVYQNVTFQQGRQLAYQAQVRPQIQAGPQLAFQARRQLNQTVPTAIFNRNAASIASPFQTTSQISINPAYIAAHRRALSQRSSRAVVQPNIPTIVRMKAIQHVSQNQATNKVVEVNNDLSVISMEQSDVSASLSNNMSVSDESLPCIVEMPDTCTEGQDESLEDAVNPGINLLTGFNSDTYKQVTLNEDMLSIAQDHALLQETSTEYNPQVSPDDVEILSLHHPVEKELPTITHNSMDTAESSVLYGHSGVLANGTEQILTSMDSSRQPFTQTVDNVHQEPEARPSSGMKRPHDEDHTDPQNPSPAKIIAIQPHSVSHIIQTDISTKHHLDQTVAKFIYGCNIPFSAVEHPLFIDMIQALRPGYTPPSRKSISTKHLDATADELKDDMKQQLKDKTVTLVEYGWSNIHNEPVITTCLQTEDKSFFLDAKDTGAMQNTAINCKIMCQENIRQAKAIYGCIVRNVVTDNAKNNEKMRQALEEDNPELNVYGCSAYWLNLLGQDITPSVIMNHIVEVNKYFRNEHQASAWLHECKESIKPHLPGDTRWKSQITSLETYITNRNHLVKIVQDHPQDIVRSIKTKIMDYNLYCQARDLVEKLHPIAHALDVCQAKSTGLALACDTWIDLLANEHLQPYKAAVQKRFDQAMLPCHFVTYLLHPDYRGIKLTAEQHEKAFEWIADKAPEYLAVAVAFENKSTPFPAYIFKTTSLHPATWWRALRRSAVPGGFIDLLVSLQTACASSASIERVFSSFSLMHNKLRDRIGVEKADKLVFCYRMLHGQHGFDY